jgi:hypothetical protein
MVFVQLKCKTFKRGKKLRGRAAISRENGLKPKCELPRKGGKKKRGKEEKGERGGGEGLMAERRKGGSYNQAPAGP